MGTTTFHRLLLSGLAGLTLAGCRGVRKDAPSADFAIVADGRPAATIVATGNRQIDADISFFSNAVFRMTGAEVEVRGRAEGERRTGCRILFELRQADLFHEDDYAIDFPDARTMKIVGTDMSCRWALNRLLEEQGVVFCAAGPYGTHYPQTNRLAFARTRRVAPVVTARLERDLYVEDPVWQRSVNGKKQKGRFFWHNVADMFPREKYGKEPWLSRIMPEKNGRRACPKDALGWQPCFTSEEGVAEAIRIACDHLDGHPEEKVYSLAVNDLEGYCECAGCRKLNGGTFKTKSVHLPRLRNFSPVYYQWVNRVAKGIAARHPHVLVGLLAYCGVIDPPPFALEPNVVPYLCFDIQQLSDASALANRRRLMSGWSKRAKAVGIWDYSFGSPYYAAFREYPDEQARFFALKTDGTCPALDGFFTEGQGTYLTSEWRRRYLYLRLAFDASRDPQAELARWYRACVGDAAAPALKAYYELWDGFWRSPALKDTHWYRSGAVNTYFSYSEKTYLFALDAATRERAGALMSEMLAQAEAHGTPDQKVRARKLKHLHDYFALRQIQCLAGLSGADRAVTKPIAEEYLRRLPDSRAALAKLPALMERLMADALDTTNAVVRGRVEMIRRFGLADDNRTLLMNGTLQQLGPRRLADAMGLALGGTNLAATVDAASWACLKRGFDVADVPSENGTPRWKLTANGHWWKAGYACLEGLVSNTTYCVSARITNPTAKTVNVTVGLNSARPPVWRSYDLGTFASAPLKPGETRTVSAIHTLHGKCPAGKILISVGDLREGEHVYADSLSLRTFEKAGERWGRGL